MRGVYGKARQRLLYNPLAHLTGHHDTERRRAAQFGVHVGDFWSEHQIEPPTMAQGLWDQMKVGTVLTLSVVAVITAAKVLSTKENSRRNY